MAKDSVQQPADVIELRVRDAAQLFNTLDPLPFRERDLAPDAEQYIVDWAEELPSDRPMRIVVHVQAPEPDAGAARDLPQAMGAFFTGRARSETLHMRALFRDGRRAFAIGLALIVAVVTFSWRLSLSFEGVLPSIVQESLVIIAWVIIWRPAEMFLYDWVPIARRRKLFRRLAAAEVKVLEEPPAP